MATPPLICNVPSFQGISMNRCTIQATDSTGAVVNSMNLCDYSLQIDNFSAYTACILPGSSHIINTDNIGTDPGTEVKLIIIKPTYTGLTTSKKYINFISQGKTLPIGDFMMLTGTPQTGFVNRGWDLNSSNIQFGSPFVEQDGMILYNPQLIKINVTIVIAGGLNITTDNYLRDDIGDYIIPEGNIDYNDTYITFT